MISAIFIIINFKIKIIIRMLNRLFGSGAANASPDSQAQPNSAFNLLNDPESSSMSAEDAQLVKTILQLQVEVPEELSKPLVMSQDGLKAIS